MSVWYREKCNSGGTKKGKKDNWLERDTVAKLSVITKEKCVSGKWWENNGVARRGTQTRTWVAATWEKDKKSDKLVGRGGMGWEGREWRGSLGQRQRGWWSECLIPLWCECTPRRTSRRERVKGGYLREYQSMGAEILHMWAHQAKLSNAGCNGKTREGREWSQIHEGSGESN